MIAVKLEGRLGNQLFQYAFIYNCAQTLKTNFYIDKSVNNFILPKYFNLTQNHNFLPDKYIFGITGYKNIFSYHFKHTFYNFLKKMHGLQEILFVNNVAPSLQLKNMENKRLYIGYFQSEEYFVNYKIDILNLFSINTLYKQRFESIIKQLPSAKKYVTVHVRRGDYVNINHALNVEYYRNAINCIHSADNYYVFVSDDPEFIRHEFSYLNEKYISESEEIIDFQFLINADICILSNSSFSWWGAYLNNRHAQIIAPKYWLGKTQMLPANIIPATWQQFE
jgi:hypothetical protein